MFQAKRAPYKRIAVVISLCVLILWGVLGTGTSLAWFTDTTPEICNIFHIADFELAVSRQLADGTWEAIDGQTKVFDEAALYEPGYTQVVALKVETKVIAHFGLIPPSPSRILPLLRMFSVNGSIYRITCDSVWLPPTMSRSSTVVLLTVMRQKLSRHHRLIAIMRPKPQKCWVQVRVRT